MTAAGDCEYEHGDAEHRGDHHPELSSAWRTSPGWVSAMPSSAAGHAVEMLAFSPLDVTLRATLWSGLLDPRYGSSSGRGSRGSVSGRRVVRSRLRMRYRIRIIGLLLLDVDARRPLCEADGQPSLRSSSPEQSVEAPVVGVYRENLHLAEARLEGVVTKHRGTHDGSGGCSLRVSHGAGQAVPASPQQRTRLAQIDTRPRTWASRAVVAPSW